MVSEEQVGVEEEREARSFLVVSGAQEGVAWADAASQ